MILLDTHAWIWWVSNPDLLSTEARVLIDQALVKRKIHISAMSVWEVAMLVAKNRLQLTMEVGDWIRTSEGLPFVQFVPVTNAIALKAVRLPLKSLNDPVDRLITATAIMLDLILITKDKRLHQEALIKTVW
ncbi:MAG: type II toxin-antitoxin system VapC family toxin [Deltaproteobacteria bacterium]|nr:type II toxin-antitoxin system VapC family toxin [Deltaproteobacteria bacterium]